MSPIQAKNCYIIELNIYLNKDFKNNWKLQKPNEIFDIKMKLLEKTT